MPGAVARQHCIPSGVATTLHPIYANRKYPLSPRCGHPSDGNAGRCMSVRFGRRAAMAFLANVRIGPNEPSQRRRRTAHVWVREAWSDPGYQTGRQVQGAVLWASDLIARDRRATVTLPLLTPRQTLPFATLSSSALAPASSHSLATRMGRFPPRCLPVQLQSPAGLRSARGTRRGRQEP